MEGTIIHQDAQTLHIKEQIYYNDSCGLSFEFTKVESEEFPYRLRIYGDILPFGNRELVIRRDGIIDGGGTATTGLPFPFHDD